ncbi:type II toxin-antitoxin system ParD family antitoxin [Sphingomonas sp.]|uniref:type II toxin-antitoxin system ParD family antitoxin n=1 Tax=Sphingomonas sp. TaxID=28214 RepID=UPI0035C81324
MATMNVSLPEEMKAWVEAEVRTGRYGNSSDVVRDLIRREQVRGGKIAHMQRLVDEGLASGLDSRPMDQIKSDIRAGVGLLSTDIDGL